VELNTEVAEFTQVTESGNANTSPPGPWLLLEAASHQLAPVQTDSSMTLHARR
jgi:hypothetical protein